MSAALKIVPEPDSLPPHDLEAERNLLGAILLAPDDCLLEARDAGVLVEWFYALAHQQVWRTIEEMARDRQEIGITSLYSVLKANGRLQDAGGLADVAGLGTNSIPGLMSEYLWAVRSCWAVRRAAQLATTIREAAQAPRASGDEMASMCRIEGERLCAALLDGQKRPFGLVDRAEAIQQTIMDMERRFELAAKKQLSGIGTGFHDLDNKCQGWQYGEVALIGARPNAGKTALLLGTARHAAVTLGVPVGIVTLEMTEVALYRRLCSIHAQIPATNIRRGSLTDQDFMRLRVATDQLRKAPLFILDGTTGKTLEQIKTGVKRLVNQHGIKLLVIDYLQKIRPGRTREKRTYEIGEVSEGLHEFVVELGVAGLFAAQLNRESEKDKGRVPRLADLAHSGQIESDGDLVCLIHRNRTPADQEGCATSLIIAKQRDGPTGAVPLTFVPAYARFESAARGQADGIPEAETRSNYQEA